MNVDDLMFLLCQIQNKYIGAVSESISEPR